MYWRINDRLNPSLPERLQALPAFDPPPGGWMDLMRRRRQRRRGYAAAGAGFALAASVLVGVGLVGLRPEPVAAPPGAVESQALAHLITRSQNLEHQLARARPQVAVWDSRRAARAAVLERELMVVDAQLNFAAADSAESLWRDRVALMDALVELHQTEAPALQYASYQY